MKQLALLITLTFFLFGHAQQQVPNTEVFLFDLAKNGNALQLSNYKNISNNEGYDSQPSFTSDSKLLFASDRKGQTDIAQYFTTFDNRSWVNFTGDMAEYSPQAIPGEFAMSCVGLGSDKSQKLYKYNLSTATSTPIISDITIAYYVWHDLNTVVSAGIDDKKLSLYVTDVRTGKSKKLGTNVGRSFFKIPNSNLVSYISKENATSWQIKSLDPISGTSRTIVNTLPESEDMCWLSDGTILMPKGNKIFAYKPNYDSNWREVASLANFNINNISRIAVSPNQKLLAIVGVGGTTATNTTGNDTNTNNGGTTTPTNTNTGEVTQAETIVQKQLDAYNSRNIDTFMATYSNDVKLYNYPNELRTEGQEQMRKGYAQWFEQTPDLRAFIKKRIVIGNKVIDEEQVTANGKIFNAVAIYEVNEQGLINKVTFLRE